MFIKRHLDAFLKPIHPSLKNVKAYFQYFFSKSKNMQELALKLYKFF